MTDEKSLTSEEHLALVRNAQAGRADEQPDAMLSSVKAKSAVQKKKKVLSRAALARQEKERLEASKTKVEKIAKDIVKRNKAAAKHGSVQRNLDTVAERKPKAPKVSAAPVPKVKEQQPMSPETGYDIFMAREAVRDR